MLCSPLGAVAQNMLTETFENQPETRWRFFTDGVMGGVSSGEVTFRQEENHSFAHLSGEVSTANNGGFIQMRMDLPAGAAKGALGVRLVVRGNDDRYFIHLRTDGTILPWQYYQSGFDVSREWSEIRLPFDSFQRSGRFLAREPKDARLTSMAVVAYGRDYTADIEVREIGFY
jgi:hypothetical protein